MFRSTVSLVVGLLFVPIAETAPKLKDRPAAAYYPTVVGDRWVTETKSQTATVENTEVVTAVEAKDGETIVSVGREVDGQVGPGVSQLRITDKGHFRMATAGRVYDKPYCILQLPLKPGAAWASEATRDGATTTKFRYQVAKEEDVEVPAGKFRAFRIDVEAETGSGARRSALWYAPRVGVVRYENFDPAFGYVKVRKSFTPGK